MRHGRYCSASPTTTRGRASTGSGAMSGRSQPQRRGARQVDAEYREAERMRCGVDVLCPRVRVMDQREPIETNEQLAAKVAKYNTFAHLRAGVRRSDNRRGD